MSKSSEDRWSVGGVALFFALVSLVGWWQGDSEDPSFFLWIFWFCSVVAAVSLPRSVPRDFGAPRFREVIGGVVCVLGGIAYVFIGLLSTMTTGVWGMTLVGGLGLFGIVWGAWLLLRSQRWPRLETRYLTERAIRARLLGDESLAATGERPLRRVDRTYACDGVDPKALERAFPNGSELLPVGAQVDMVNDRPKTDPWARVGVGQLAGSPCVVLLWWRDDRDGRIQAAAYTWASASRRACPMAFDVVGERLGSAWRAGRMVEVSRRWWLFGP